METLVQQVMLQYGFQVVALVAFVGVCVVHGAIKQAIRLGR